MFGELAECIDGQQVRGLEGYLDALIALVGLLSAYRPAVSLPIVQKAKRTSMTAPLPLQPFLDHDRRSGVFIHGQVIRNQRIARLSILDFDGDRPLRAPCLELARPASPVPSPAQPELE